MIVHRKQLSLLSLLLTLCLVAGNTLPSLGLWECHHAARIIMVPSTTMPCAMDMAHMPDMPCCRAHWLATHTPKPNAQQIGAAPCKPSFKQLAPGKPLGRGETSSQPRLLLATHIAALPTSSAVPPAPLIHTLWERPPPRNALFASASVRSPCLRAPPTV